MKLKIIPAKPYRQISDMWDHQTCNDRKMWLDYYRMAAKLKRPFLGMFGARL